MNKLLWLDDIRDPFDGDWLVYSPIDNPDVNWVKSYGEFITWIEINGLPDAICFDHDLADNFENRANMELTDWFDINSNREYTGYDCAKWLVSYCIASDLEIPLYNVHSVNHEGAENINRLLDKFKNYRSIRS
jgi:hypothetical protein